LNEQCVDRILLYFQISHVHILLILLKCSDLEHRLLLQSPEHLPILSDKDYASSNYVPPTSVAECAALPPSIPCLPPTHVRCSSPLFDEDERVLSEMKLKPAKGVAEEFSLDALILPKSFMDLEVIFDQVLKILATAHARGGVGKRGTPLEALKGDMERMYQRSFRKEHLQQITALVPDCLILSHTCKDGKACHRTVCINTSKMNLCLDRQVIHWKYLAEMKSSLRQSMLSFLQTRHTEFLQKYHPELKLNPERNLSYKWHADFDLSAVHLPSIDLPPLPQVEVPVIHSVIKDVVVQITPEIELAFEKIQAETMTPEKLQYITDCSKSAIGKQNIEKIQKYELKQFALQQSFKLADERDAETKFQMAADALRCLFRHRNKPALPLADVLKVLQQTKGLTFKSSLDAMDMVNQVVEKLPAFFSRKKFPTYGEMVRFLSSELFPWHKPRV
jgi:hypothetical protein